MAYQFADAENHRYREGGFFLGVDDQGHEIGITTERHVLMVAGARSGKGAALAIPNLLRWPHNALVIDPKGENAAATWQAREAMGQRVYVLDPFKTAKVPDRLRASCNLLAGIRPESLTAREDIRMIADGMVMRYKSEDSTWDNGAVSVLAGVIAYVCADPVPEGRNLPAVRQLLTLPPDTLKAVFAEMAKTDVFAGLCKAAASIGLSDSRKNKEFVGGAVDHSEWLDSPAMAAMLSANTFDLSELKTGKATVYLVLPPKYIVDHARFLRLFVRAALDVMAQDLEGNKCLFLLDEFFALGRIDQISKAAGLMPGYGVQLWPILQDLGQLVTLYGKDGAHSFFGNADAHIFFGNTDMPTLNYISDAIGTISADEINSAFVTPSAAYLDAMAAGLGSPPTPFQVDPRGRYGRHSGLVAAANIYNRMSYADRKNQFDQAARQHQVDVANARAAHDHKMKNVGRARLSPLELRELVAKKDGDVVAKSMIVFLKGSDILNLRLSPYFQPLAGIENPAARNAPSPATRQKIANDDPRVILPAVFILTCFLIGVGVSDLDGPLSWGGFFKMLTGCFILSSLTVAWLANA